MTGKSTRNDIADILAALRQADADRPPINPATLVMHIANINQFFQIVTDIATLIIAARFQLAGGHFIFTDIEQQKALNSVDVKNI